MHLYQLTGYRDTITIFATENTLLAFKITVLLSITKSSQINQQEAIKSDQNVGLQNIQEPT